MNKIEIKYANEFRQFLHEIQSFISNNTKDEIANSDDLLDLLIVTEQLKEMVNDAYGELDYFYRKVVKREEMEGDE